MSQFGLKIRNYEGAVLYEYNLGLRDCLSYTNAMFSNSLLSDYLKTIGLKTYKEKSTRDIICVKFGFGTRSYEENKKKIKKTIEELEENDEKLEYFNNLLQKIEENKDKYVKISSAELRKIFYKDGIDITYTDKNKSTTIHYKMLYRSAGKAKEGSVMFINEKLFNKAQKFIRMGIKLPKHNAPIVEIGAYSSLISSSIVGRIKIDPDEILVLKDVDSFITTNVIAIETNENKECISKNIENYKLKNTLFDGQGLIDSSIFPSWAEGYVLLRHHFCKMACFHTHIQDFFKDYYKEKYETATVKDMFGREIKVKDIKLITTNNAMKWLKFNVSYDYWSEWVRQNGSLFGIVKTAHRSKLGDLQRMSYQMVNALDLARMDNVVSESKEYINKLKMDDGFFIQYLKDNINFVNDFEVLVALVEQDPDFINSEYFRERRYSIIKGYIQNFKNGKLLQNADNLVIVGSPFAMLMHAVGENPLKDPTFDVEDGTTQCWTERFNDNEFLAEFRSPFNSRNNLGHLHNKKHELLDRYFEIGKQCIAVNLNGTDFQSRNNGSDQDSDSIYVTNQPEIVSHAKYCVENYPTIENCIPQEKTHYDNLIENFALVDSKLAEANSAIGESSNLAQLALTYTYNFDDKKYYDNVCILSVLAQICIDNAKRSFDVDFLSEIKRIKKEIDVENNGLPYFWFLIKRKGKFAKEQNKEKKKMMEGLNNSLVCPMNYVCDLSFSPRRYSTPSISMDNFFISYPIESGRKMVKRAESFIEKYSAEIFNSRSIDDDYFDDEKLEELFKDIRSIYISKDYRGIVSALINRAFRITDSIKKNKGKIQSNLWRNRPLLLKVLYTSNKDCLLNCFSKNVKYTNRLI